MGFLEDMARQMAMSHTNERRAATPDETAEIAIDFQPIPDLRPGDVLTYKSEAMRATKTPKIGESCTVYRVGNFSSYANDEAVRMRDFTYLIIDEDGDIFEAQGESRRFKRVTA